MAEKVLFESQSLDFSYNEMFGVYVSVDNPPPFSLVIGEKYKVLWDGIAYEATAIDTSGVMPNTVGAGNGAAWGYAGNNEPFVILYTEGSDISFISLTDTAPNTHTVSVYQTVEDAVLYTVSSTSLKKVADAIREKSGSADPISFPDGFVQKISSITTGGGGDGGIVVEEITDSWEDIIAAVNDGTYKTKYKLGNYKPIMWNFAGTKTFNMQLVAFDKDLLADGSGVAATTWIATGNISNTEDNMDTGSAYGMGWSKCKARRFLNGDEYSTGYMDNYLSSDAVKAAVKSVTKYQYEHDSKAIVEQSTADRFWIPSWREMFGVSGSGVTYANVFYETALRVKEDYSFKTAEAYWLRDMDSFSSATSFKYKAVSETGELTAYNGRQSSNADLVLCFCI